MSWQEYVDKQLVDLGCDSGAILGINGTAWAQSPGLNISVAEGQKLMEGFSKPSLFVKDGIVLNGKEWLFIRNNERSVFAKNGIDCVICSRTIKAVVIAFFSGPPAHHSAVVERLADYLTSVGF